MPETKLSLLIPLRSPATELGGEHIFLQCFDERKSKMSAYWISRVHVTDPNTYSKYAALAGPAIEKHGGVILARGGKQVILEGGAFERSVVVRFPSLEAAEKCYHSPEYAEARKYAAGAAERHMVAVEGVD